jgi:ribosomal protein L13
MVAKHSGTFPLNHGKVGDIIATGRYGPHAEHGQDMVIIQASQVSAQKTEKMIY